VATGGAAPNPNDGDCQSGGGGGAGARLVHSALGWRELRVAVCVGGGGGVGG
jgi:hypothetical protein